MAVLPSLTCDKCMKEQYAGQSSEACMLVTVTCKMSWPCGGSREFWASMQVLQRCQNMVCRWGNLGLLRALSPVGGVVFACGLCAHKCGLCAHRYSCACHHQRDAAARMHAAE